MRWRRYGAVMGSGTAALSDVRHTEPEALGNLAAVLKLCAAGKLRCSERTRRPSAATTRTVGEALVAGDFYPDEAIAAFAIFYTKVHNRVLRPLMATDRPQAPPPLRAALHTIDQHVDARLAEARLPSAAA